MSDSLDPTVRQILAEIGKHGGASGVTQAGDADINILFECLRPAHPARGREAAVMPGPTSDNPAYTPDCITERHTEHGYWWRYQQSDGEARETLRAAIMIAGNVAATEARKSGKTFVVARAARGVDAIYVFAGDHPDASSAGINIMFEFTPEGERIRRPAIRH
jgi:hypothetical protein